MAAKVRISTLTCKRCGHTWVPRQAVVTLCARCKSTLWNVPKTPKK
jgi:uncharacterized OB-fold protein